MMNITFSNNTSEPIIVTFSDNIIEIESFGKATIPTSENSSCEFKLKRTKNSRFEKGHYYLSGESSYFCNIENDETVIEIIQNKKTLSYNVELEYLTPKINDLLCELKKCMIIDETNMKKLFRKKELMHFFFFDLFEYYPELCILLLCVDIVLICFKGWIIGGIALGLSYCFLLFINFFIKKLINVFFLKAFNFNDDRKDFYKCFEEDTLINACAIDKTE